MHAFMGRKIAKRDPDAGYYSTDLWIPKSRINVEGMKAVLTIPVKSAKKDVVETEEVCAYKETKHHLIVPRDFFELSSLDEFPIFDVRPQSYPASDVKSSVVLDVRSPHDDVQQKAAAAMLASTGGVLQLGCGKGKTVIALHVGALIGGNILIVVENSELFRQWEKEVVEHLDVPGGVGAIRGGKCDWQKSVVVATYHSLAKLALDPPSGFTEWFSVVFFDEAHHLGARTFIRGAGLLPCRRFGLTATPERRDGMDVLYRAYLGETVYKDLRPDLSPEAVFLETGITIDRTDDVEMASIIDASRSVNFNLLASALGRKEERIQIVVDLLRKARARGRTILVLSHSIEALLNLYLAWGGSKSRMSDLKQPTPAELGIKVAPSKLTKETHKRIERVVEYLKEKLGEEGLPEAEARRFRKDLDVNEFQLECHAAAVLYEKEIARRENQFVKKVLATASSDAGLLIGDAPQALREQTIRDKSVIFAIMRFGKEALNKPTLDTAIGLEPVGQEGGLRQLVGRTLRKSGAPGTKLQPVMVILEDRVGFLLGMVKKLRRFMKNNPEDAGGPINYKITSVQATKDLWEQYEYAARAT